MQMRIFFIGSLISLSVNSYIENNVAHLLAMSLSRSLSLRVKEPFSRRQLINVFTLRYFSYGANITSIICSMASFACMTVNGISCF